MVYGIAAAAMLAVTFFALSVLEPARIPGRVQSAARPAGLEWLAAKRWALEAWLMQAALPMSPGQFVALAGAFLLVFLVLITMLFNWQAGVALTVVLAWCIRRVVQVRIAARGRYVAEELPAFLRLVIGRLRTGFSLLQSLEMASKEGPMLLGLEMQRAVAEVNMGTPLEAALERLAGRLKHPDIDLVVTTLLIGREIGGNLSETLAALAETVAQRGRLRRQIHVLTAQPRLSGIIVGLLPFILLAIITVIKPDFTMVLVTRPIGWMITAIGLIMQLLGILFIRRILRSGEELLP